MANNQKVVEDALFQIKNLEETLQENAKGILQSTMSEEIKQLVKESLRESKDDEIDEQDEPLIGGEEELDSETEDEDEDIDDDMELDNEMSFDDEMEFDDEDEDMDDELEFDDEETIDMTNASDEEVLRVFKAMGDEDGIVVKKEGGNVHFTADSNTDITKGLIYLLIRVLDQRSPQEILTANLDFIQRIGMGGILGSQRSNGLAAMINQMKRYALAFQTQQNA
jgi:cysteine desulfuration protein SufE